MFVPVAFLKGNTVINLTSPSAVSWPAPSSAAVAPVSAVPAVPALSSAGSESQTGPRSGQGGRGHAFPSPGEHSAQAWPQSAGRASGASSPEAHDFQAQTLRRQAERETHAAREREKQAMEHLKDVLTNVWQASAAVVDRALGREPSTPGTQSDTAPDLSQVSATLVSRRRSAPAGAPELPAEMPALPWRPASTSGESSAILPDNEPVEVVAYDDRGNSSLAPLDLGSHFSQRV